MSDENLSLIRRIQLKELEILKVFQEICRKHGLRYFAIGGTCLGAVRHGGFIPWDDDIDMGMPYEDYLKFAAIAETELPPNYALYGFRQPKLFHNAYAIRIHDKTTTFLNPDIMNEPELGVGIHIDLLVMNGLPPKPEQEKVVKSVILYEKLNHLFRLSNRTGKTWQKVMKRILNCIIWPAKIFLPYDYYLTKMENLLSKYPFDASDKVVFPWPDALWPGAERNSKGLYTRVYDYELFSSSVEMPFEDTTVAVPAGYDRYLTLDYGDYMTPPPEGMRVPSSSGKIVDFEKPYTYYFGGSGLK